VKKLISTALAAATLFSTITGTAFASDLEDTSSENAHKTVVCLSNDIPDSVVQNIENCVDAYTYDENGNRIDLDCEINIERLSGDSVSSYGRDMESDGDRYIITATASGELKYEPTKVEIYDEENAKFTMHMTMAWLDRPGWENAIERLDGRIDITKGTYTGGEVRCGYNHTRAHVKKKLTASEKSFNFDPDYDYADEPGVTLNGQLHACFAARFNERTYPAYVCVTPPIYA